MHHIDVQINFKFNFVRSIFDAKKKNRRSKNLDGYWFCVRQQDCTAVDDAVIAIAAHIYFTR